MQTLKVFYERFLSESPKFWKKIIIKAAIIGTAAGAVAVAPDDKFVPPTVKKIAQYVTFFAYGIGVAGKLTTNDPELIEKSS